MGTKEMLLSPSSNDSVWTNQFRSLRNALLLQKANASIKTVLVTSPTDGQGKTVISTNLAVSLAENGDKVLLLEGNYRHSEIATIFEVDSAGLSEFLRNESASTNPKISQSKIENLDILPAGSVPEDVSSLFVSKKFSVLLEQLENQYDWIIIDGETLVGHADMEIIATMVDYTLIVVGYRQVKKELFDDMLSNLDYHKISDFSVVYNETPKKRTDFDY